MSSVDCCEVLVNDKYFYLPPSRGTFHNFYVYNAFGNKDHLVVKPIIKEQNRFFCNTTD